MCTRPRSTCDEPHLKGDVVVGRQLGSTYDEEAANREYYFHADDNGPANVETAKNKIIIVRIHFPVLAGGL